MSLIAFSIITFIVIIISLFTFYSLFFKGKWEYVIYFLILFLPIYTTYLSLVYQATSSITLVKSFQFFKDLLVILAVCSMFSFHRNIFLKPWRLNKVDKLFLTFILLSFFYLLLPMGAPLINKILYFKSLLIPALVYFLGRNTSFSDEEIHKVFKFIFGITILAFGVNLIEILINTHIQTFTGYAVFNYDLYDQEPSGNFGLTWTFETQAMTRRFASIFADPLEYSSSILLPFSAALIFFLTNKKEHAKPYALIVFIAFLSLLFASSRAAFGAFFIMLFFIALVFKLRTLIFAGITMLLMFTVFVVFFASDDFYYFVIDTLTFQNLSSVGHLIEWGLALDGMITNPLGLGLGTSGSVGSVIEDIKVGGENQFLIIGVQMGWIGMFIYILLLVFSVKYSVQVFKNIENVYVARIAFTGAATKVGMLLPLFTANAELYSYVSWVSWWMIGYAMNYYYKAQSHEA
jgi:hypothetical protein